MPLTCDKPEAFFLYSPENTSHIIIRNQILLLIR